MNFEELVKWAEAAGQKEAKLAIFHWRCYEHATYLADLSVKNLTDELMEGGGMLTLGTSDEFDEYLRGLDAAALQGAQDSMLEFWATIRVGRG